MNELTVTPASEPDDRTDRIARRTLLGVVGAWTVGGLGVALLGLTGRGASVAAASPVPTHDPKLHAILTAAASPTATPAPRPPGGADHDQVHEAVTKAFPAKTQGQGLQELPSTVVNGARQFDLVCGKVKWEVTPGNLVDAYAYNGQLPRPTTRTAAFRATGRASRRRRRTPRSWASGSPSAS